MKTDLNGKTVLVTGSSRGIGAETAKYLAECGMRVAVTYAGSKAKAEEIYNSLKGEGHLLLPLNVADATSVSEGFDVISKEFGGLYGLVNNAGITRDQLLLRLKDEDFDAVIETNLKGTFLCTKLAVKMMMKARSGSIVNITSVIGQTGQAGQSNYAASKAGVEAFTKSVAQEVASRSVRLNCVAPGFIATDMTDELPEDRKKAILGAVPMNSIGEPLDVAQAVAFLLSENSKYITGQTISVNGGLFM
ncbi:MAG: 3-oxoacyl-[acyl-carrier-protein] reductase [Bdellovibrionales bacterium]|nr:3-oxoacyl-[acyl-carrier-protein] reductase [Bdellovibrionales bacterium]